MCGAKSTDRKKRSPPCQRRPKLHHLAKLHTTDHYHATATLHVSQSNHKLMDPTTFLSFFLLYIYIYCFTRVYVRDTHLIIYSIFLSWFVAQLNNGASFSLLPLLNTTRPPRPTISSLPPLSPCFNHQI